jgi:protein-disulfide isomerase
MHKTIRSLSILLTLLLVAACGPEAPARIGRPDLPTAMPGTTPLIQASTAALLSDQNPNPRAQGDPSAPIVVIEYSDYQCPYCLQFAHGAQPQIEEQYIKTGKVYVIFRDLPLTSIHPGALLAAHAANCAAEQGHFAEMQSRLFNGQATREWGTGSSSDLQTFVRYAEELNLDSVGLQRCVETSRHAAQIEADVRSATDKGINSTPAFLVNGQLLLGARPFDSWKQLLDTLLSR